MLQQIWPRVAKNNQSIFTKLQLLMGCDESGKPIKIIIVTAICADAGLIEETLNFCEQQIGLDSLLAQKLDFLRLTVLHFLLPSI